MSEEVNLKELLDEIIEKVGPYSQDHLKHAENVIEKASKNAQKIKEQLLSTFKYIMDDGEDGQSADCATSAKYWYYQLKGEPIPKDY
jgi:hypothetical protein